MSKGLLLAQTCERSFEVGRLCRVGALEDTQTFAFFRYTQIFLPKSAKKRRLTVAVNRLLRCIKPNGYGLPLAAGRGIAYSHLVTGTTGKNHGIQTNRRYRYLWLKICFFHNNLTI